MTPFQKELKHQIHKYIRAARQGGTVAMSLRNLMQCVKTPSTSLEGAPDGIGASARYEALFTELCETRHVKAFLL